MTHAEQVSETNPSQISVDTDALVECIEVCFDCAQACTACADACLGEQDVQMLARCIRLDLDCSNVCEATGKILSRQTAFEPEMARAALEACARAYRLWGGSVRTTPSTAWSTAGCAPKSAAAASRLAILSSRRYQLSSRKPWVGASGSPGFSSCPSIPEYSQHWRPGF